MFCNQGEYVWPKSPIAARNRGLASGRRRSHDCWRKGSRQWVFSSIYDHPGMLYGCACSTNQTGGKPKVVYTRSFELMRKTNSKNAFDRIAMYVQAIPSPLPAALQDARLLRATSCRSIGDATETRSADPSGLRILSPFSGLASALRLLAGHEIQVIVGSPSKAAKNEKQ